MAQQNIHPDLFNSTEETAQQPVHVENRMQPAMAAALAALRGTLPQLPKVALDGKANIFERRVFPVSLTVVSECKKLADAAGGYFVLVAVAAAEEAIAGWAAGLLVFDVRGAVTARALKGSEFQTAVRAVRSDVKGLGRGVAAPFEACRLAAMHLAGRHSQAAPAGAPTPQQLWLAGCLPAIRRELFVPLDRGGCGIVPAHFSGNGYFGEEPSSEQGVQPAFFVRPVQPMASPTSPTAPAASPEAGGASPSYREFVDLADAEAAALPRGSSELASLHTG